MINNSLNNSLYVLRNNREIMAAVLYYTLELLGSLYSKDFIKLGKKNINSSQLLIIMDYSSTFYVYVEEAKN